MKENKHIDKKDGNDIFTSSLNTLSTSDIAPKLPKKHPPLSSFLIKGAVILILVSIMLFCAVQIASSIKGYAETNDLYSDFADSWGSLDLLLNKTSPITKSDKNNKGSTTENYGTPTLPQAPSNGESNDEVSATIILLRAKFAELKEKNPDVIGWITVPNTFIDYPVVKTTDNDYYLDHSITGSYLNSGTIFVDYRNEGDWSDRNTVIYGHNMASGAMFAHLARFKLDYFFSQNQYIYIQTEEGIYVYRIFSVYETSKYNPYTRIYFSSDNDFTEWAKSMHQASIRKRSYSFKANDKIITLSTCTNGFGDDGRLAVHAVLKEIRK